MYKNDNSAYLRFLIMSPDPNFTSFSFLDHGTTLEPLEVFQRYLVG